MALPTYQEIYKTLLSTTSDGASYSIRQLREQLAGKLNLSGDDLEALLPSGSMHVWDSRVGWCKTYLVKAGLLRQPKRGYVEITERGRDVLKEDPVPLDDKYLMRFPEFQAFYAPAINQQPSAENLIESTNSTGIAPDEMIERAYQQLRKQVETDMLDRIMSCSASFFEQLVVDLLVKMGYGGSRHDVNNSLIGPGRVTRRSGDEGIDGVIKEDKLGLDTLYIQAKRWGGAVGRPEVQRFAGALHGQRSKKGVMITTSTFTREARDYVGTIETKIVLIDGKLLVELMFDHNLGCTPHKSFELKSMDGDYFEPESSS